MLIRARCTNTMPCYAPRGVARRAFTMAEILAAVAIVAIMGAVVIPAMMTKIRSASTAALAQTLFALSQGVFQYRRAVTVYPPGLNYLASGPTTSTTDACGTTGIGSNANSWRGPYITREVPTAGVQIGDALIENSLRRVTGAGSTVYLLIDVAGVERKVATDLESEFDTGAADSTSGTIRWTSSSISYTAGSIVSNIPAASPGTVNLSFAMPISGC